MASSTAIVYALHDEPLPLADALHLDTHYMTFLGQAHGHGHARVRAVAQGVLDSIDEDIQTGQDVCRQEHPIERRLESRVDWTTVGIPGAFFHSQRVSSGSCIRTQARRCKGVVTMTKIRTRLMTEFEIRADKIRTRVVVVNI